MSHYSRFHIDGNPLEVDLRRYNLFTASITHRTHDASWTELRNKNTNSMVALGLRQLGWIMRPVRDY